MPTHPSKPDFRGGVPPGQPPRTLILGCGYLGLRVAKNAIFVGDQVWGTTRDPEKADHLESLGVTPLILDWTDSRTLRRLPEVDRILIAVSYDRQNRQSRRESQVGGLQNLLEVVSPQTRVCYISTTGVYHQSDGEWVDEESLAQPTREGGSVHLEAERLLQQLRPDSPWTILRLAGIYGPHRVPRAADVVAGRPIASPSDGYLNLIHVEDAADVVMATWTEAAQRLYVVSDDLPVVRAEFYREIASQCGVPVPQFVDPDPAAAVTVRSATNKRIRNRRMKRDLVSELRFPTYREGLANVLSDSRQ